MNVLNQLGLGRLGNSGNGPEDERVLELFRNRAELKKAYLELQDEVHALKERLRQQESATTRVQEILERTESRLERREQGYPTLVFYQLRRLWRAGYEVLAAFAADLEKQQVERERRSYFVESNRQQFAVRQQCDATLASAQADAVNASRALRSAEDKLASMSKPWHRFARKEHEATLPALRATAAAADLTLVEARQAREKMLAEADKAFPGLSVEARRSINLAVIACAEILCQRFARSPLIGLARSAGTRREAVDEYGSHDECESLMDDIALAHAVLEQRGQLPQEVKQRAEQMKRTAVYLHDDDTIPTAESLLPAVPAGDPVSIVLESTGRQPTLARPPNVLAEDSWDLFRVLIR